MPAATKELKNRIHSVDSTLHLTKAMGLVAASKMRRTIEDMKRSREYAEALEQSTDRITALPDCLKNHYMISSGGKTVLVVIAGDRGLAGGYNANVFRLVDGSYADAEVIPIGKRACDHYHGESNSSEHISGEEIHRICQKICGGFLSGTYGRVGLVYTRYVNMMVQTAELRWLLPIEPSDPKGEDPVFEPDENTVLDLVIPEYLFGLLYAAVRESFASETAARKMAMDYAGKNAQEMIGNLRLEYNRARQNAITQEITEIVAGSDA